MSRATVQRQFIIDEAERTIAALEAAPQGDVCESHSSLAKGIATSLRMLIPLYRAEENGSCSPVQGLLKGTPLALAWGWVPIPFLIFLWLVGKSRGWW